MSGSSNDNQNGLGDIFKGVGKLFNVIVDMAEKNITERSSTGELFSSDDNGLQGKYGISVKLGMKDDDTENIVYTTGVVEPQTDILMEKGHTVVIVEMPGIKKENFEYKIDGNSLLIIGKASMKTYKKSIEIPGITIIPDDITVTENNGIYKILIKHIEE